MVKIKCDINQQDLKRVDLHFSNLNNFHSLEVVDRVSETQLQVGENLAVKGLKQYVWCVVFAGTQQIVDTILV